MLSHKLLFASLFVVSTAMYGATYTYTTIQYPGAIGTYPVSVNNEGEIAGYFFDSGYTAHGFTYAAGVFTQIDAGGNCYESFVTGVNDKGVLAGYCFATQGGTLNFIGTSGAFAFYKVPGVLDSYTEGINNYDLTVGWYITNNNDIASFVTQSGKHLKTFTAPNSPGTAVYGINNLGVAVGNGIPGTGGLQQGFTLTKGTYSFFYYPASYESFFNGVNDLTQVVGDYSLVARGPVLAFVFQGGTFTDLAVPNATSSVASGINNAGLVVGYYVTGSSSISTNASGFVATPQ